MLIKLNYLIKKYNLNIQGILHIGAHYCEELKDYLQSKIPTNKILWIEGNPIIVKRAQKRNKGIFIKSYLVSDIDDEKVFLNIANHSMSSSILNLGTHKTHHPEVKYIGKKLLKTNRIDTIYKLENIESNFANFLNIDIQGYELKALKRIG